MKIQVVIEATSIKEYTEAIQALAAGYTVQAVKAPVTIVKEENTYAEAKQAVETDTVKVAEEKPKKPRKQAEKPVKEPKDTTTPKTEEKTARQETKASESKYGFPAVKQIAMKLSKITDGKAEVKFLLEKFGADKLSSLQEENYDEFHELAAKAIADHDNAKSNEAVEELTKEDKPSESVQTSDDETQGEDAKEITLEMIRGKAKELSVAGYKEEIKAALKAIGAPALTKIPKDQYASFYETMGNIQ